MPTSQFFRTGSIPIFLPAGLLLQWIWRPRDGCILYDGEEVLGDDSTIETTDLPALPDDPGWFILYQTEDSQTRVEVRIFGETVWLSQKAMAELFQKDVRTINEHIRNVFSERELREETAIRKSRITGSDGKEYDTLHYNLDVIISVGYRVKSHRGTQFGIWAT